MRSLFTLFWTVSRRYLGQRWDRAGLIVASIALGVAMLVSTQLLNKCLDAAASEPAAALTNGGPLKPFKIRAGGQVHEVNPVGEVQLGGKAAKLGGFLLVMDIRQAAHLLNQDGLCERIDIYLSPGADREAVRQA